MDKNQLMPTHNIANKGFSGIRRFVARFNFSCTLIGNRPQSLTGHIVTVSNNYKRQNHEIQYLFFLLFTFFYNIWL